MLRCRNLLVQKKIKMSSVQRFAVVSDIHGNFCALQEVVSYIRKEDIPKVFILGDLLTYGCEPNGVITLLKELNDERCCIFIKGNHDQFYFDLADGADPFSYKMPEFVKESVIWTNENCRYDLRSEFKWLENHYEFGCFFAHANPFEYGNWRYINSESDHLEAAVKLNELNIRVAFWGHTHRQKVALCRVENNKVDDDPEFIDSSQKQFSINLKTDNNISIFNAGSIGQPRGVAPSFLNVNVCGQIITIDIIGLSYDSSAHIAQINNSSMSLTTKNQLISYFDKDNT